MAWQKDYGKSAKVAADEALAQAQRAEEGADNVASAIAEVDAVVAENKTRFLTAVSTVALRNSTYPNPLNGDTVRVTSEAKTYRFAEGSGWVVTDEYNATAIDNVTAQLADTAQDIEGRGINVDNFPMFVPEVGEEGRIQRAIDYAYTNNYKNVFVPSKERQIRSTVVLKEGLSLIAYNSKFVNKENHIKFLRMESHTKLFGLEIEGFNHLTLDNNAVGIIFEGANSLQYVEDIVIQDVFIHDVGFYGIYSNFAKDVYVDRARLRNIGYGGFVHLSPDNVNISNSIIKGVTSNGTNGYGVGFSREAYQSLTDYPRAKNCTAINVIVEDIPDWEGFDTHGGDNIKFLQCTTRNCKVGIAIVSANSTLSATTDVYASNNCTIDGALIFGLGTGSGIVIAGAPGTLDTPKEYAKGCKIMNSKIYNGGSIGTNTNGSIRILDTEGLTISETTLEGSYENGILFINTNNGFFVGGCIIIDTRSATFTGAPCIHFSSDYNKGTVGINTYLRKTPTLDTYVSETAIRISSGANNRIAVALGYSTCTNAISGGNGQNYTYGYLGGNSNIYRGGGSPEGVITAQIGSQYINLNGGAGTTFWVKQTGVGNTGWVGK